jgi:hypothetical protein
MGSIPCPLDNIKTNDKNMLTYKQKLKNICTYSLPSKETYQKIK